MTNDHLKQTGFDSFFRETLLPPLTGGCALAAIASAPASIIKSVYYFFDHNHTCGLLNISALHVQYGIQAFAKFKRPECTRLHLRELDQSQKYSRKSMHPKLRRKVRGSQFWWALYRAHFATVYKISRPPLSQNPPPAPDSKEKFVAYHPQGLMG